MTVNGKTEGFAPQDFAVLQRLLAGEGKSVPEAVLCEAAYGPDRKGWPASKYIAMSGKIGRLRKAMTRLYGEPLVVRLRGHGWRLRLPAIAKA